MMHRSLTLTIGLIVTLTSLALHGQQPLPSEPVRAQTKGDTKLTTQAKTKADEPAKEKEKAKTSTDEEPVITHHRLLLDGKEPGIHRDGRSNAA